MLVLPAELTHDQAPACSRMLAHALRAESAATVIAEARSLERFDSSALSVLLDCRREALAMGKSFAVAHLPARLRKLATVYGVEGLLPAA